MRFIFIDEIEQHQKDKSFFGIGLFSIDSFFYQSLCSDFKKHFRDCGWDNNIEFKGKYLFSKKGDDSIPIDKRIGLVNNIASSTVARHNSKTNFTFVFNRKGKTKENYFLLVSNAIKGLNKKAKSGGKNLVAIYYDSIELFKPNEMSLITEEALSKKDLYQVELPCSINSCNKTIGLIYCDVLSYLASWHVLSPQNNESEQASLFELTKGERDKEKLAKIREILAKVKPIETKEIY